MLCNKPYSGTQVIADYGEEHLRTGKLIVYTSADSVFQIAAHEELVPPEQLYEYCRAARRILTGKNGVGRVIARPFVRQSAPFYQNGEPPRFFLPPPGLTMLDVLQQAGMDVIGIGKMEISLRDGALLKACRPGAMLTGWRRPSSCWNGILMGLLL